VSSERSWWDSDPGLNLKALLLTIGVTILLGAQLWSMWRDEQSWQRFKLEHACKQAGVTTWTCSDGKTYRR
jgi:hypothetical protein